MNEELRKIIESLVEAEKELSYWDAKAEVLRKMCYKAQLEEAKFQTSYYAKDASLDTASVKVGDIIDLFGWGNDAMAMQIIQDARRVKKDDLLEELPKGGEDNADAD